MRDTLRRHRLARLFVVASMATTAVSLAPGQILGTRPAMSQRAVEPERLTDLLGLIEGQNSAQVRLTGARELLRLNWSEAPARLTSMLHGSNTGAKTAMATALADLPEYLVPQYIDPLIEMLGLADESASRAAGAALAAFEGGESLPALRVYALDAARPVAGRAEAIRALGLMPQREAAAVLAELLDATERTLAEAATVGLSRLTGVRFDGDIAAAREWWTENRVADPDQWQRGQIRRLLDQQRRTESSVATLETRLSNALRELYALTADSERPALLNTYLDDSVLPVRLLGLELVQNDLSEGRPLSTDTVAAVRGLITDPAPQTRAAAIRTIATLRGAGDGDLFVAMLATERDRGVRLALVNATGYLGNGAAVDPLLSLLDPGDERMATAATAALGRLAERGALADAGREKLVQALLRLLPQAPREAAELRERTIWAMSRLADRRFSDAFVAALDPAEAPTVRQAGVRGVVVLADARLNPALIRASRDADASVRQIAVEALGRTGHDDAALQALWGRLALPDEADETVRETAWAGALRILQERTIDEIEAAIPRIPGNGEPAARRAVDLLQILEARLAASAEQRDRLGRVRARLAERQARSGAIDDALRSYLAAVIDLNAVGDSELERVVIGLLRFALTNDRYDTGVAEALAALKPSLNGDALWEYIRDEIECRLTADGLERALTMLQAFRQRPPALLSEAVQQDIAMLRRRGQDLRSSLDGDAVAAAIGQLRADAANAAARNAIAQLGLRAVPGVCDALLAAIDARPADPDFERLLHEVLAELVPEWPGCPPEASPTERREAVAAARQLASIDHSSN